MTRKQLRQFIQARNKSSYRTNLAFQSDARFYGHFDIEELGQAKRFTIDGFGPCYQWRFRCEGQMVKLVEFGFQLYVSYATDAKSVEMFELMKKAKPVLKTVETPE